MKLNAAAKATAWCGLRTPVETTVAMELAASCRPFMKSKASASATSSASVPKPISSPLIGGTPGGHELARTMPSARFATSSQRSVIASSCS